MLHIDSPWGGGKTTFANFIARILNPNGFEGEPGDAETRHSLFRNLRLDDEEYWPRDFAERRWITVTFNAWQNQHVSPPWWNFSESIRIQCLKALPWFRRLSNEISEGWWRIWSPETKTTVAAILILIAFVLIGSNFIDIHSLFFGTDAGQTRLTRTGGAMTLIGLTLAGGSGLALLTSFRSGVRKVIDSAGSSTDEAALGAADPLWRFRERFARSIRNYKRPLLVIIDDLDRCEPEYVVELVRGMLTIFRSPHVVFMLLGDKSWIETSFEVVNGQMANAHTEDNISFGGRFAEKAIQLSFILPEPAKASRIAYIDYLLLSRNSRLAPSGTGARPSAKSAGENPAAARSPGSEQSSQQDQQDLESQVRAFENETIKRFRAASSGTERQALVESARHAVEDRFGGSWKASTRRPADHQS